MILTHSELESLVHLKHRSPHELLGMHPLGDGSGVVVRTFAPGAKAVEIQPAHEKDKPTLKLKRIHRSGLFEGVTHEAAKVYAYDLVITEGEGARAAHARPLFLSAHARGDGSLPVRPGRTSAASTTSWARICA